MSLLSTHFSREARTAPDKSGDTANSNGANGDGGDWVSRLSPEAQRASRQYLAEAAALGIVPEKMPQHIAVIMDGNRRWAKDRGWLIITGHSTGAKTTRDVIHTCAGLKIPALTLYTPFPPRTGAAPPPKSWP